MRVFLVILLALVAVGAAGVWALGEFGHAFSGSQSEAREPLVIEPEIVAANDQAVPPAPAPNSAPTLQSQPAAPAAPAPAPAQVPSTETAAVPPAASEPALAPAETAPAQAARRANPMTPDRLDATGPALRSIVPQVRPRRLHRRHRRPLLRRLSLPSRSRQRLHPNQRPLRAPRPRRLRRLRLLPQPGCSHSSSRGKSPIIVRRPSSRSTRRSMFRW